MAASAYILINTEPASTRAILEQLQGISGAVVHEVLGPYDLVVDLEADTQEDVTAILRHKIRPIHGITNTVTCVCI
jgi:DNA-binding Lrp family transcriptional regulator